MAYFSRLTDIVTCNLSSILAQTEDHQVALEDIIFEMKEGLSGADRSVKTADKNVSRIEVEIGEQRSEIGNWMKAAQESLATGQEAKARQALERKHEVEDLIAGLEQQLEAAILTRDHLRTMMNALQARLADASRRLKMLTEGASLASPALLLTGEEDSGFAGDRSARIDAELEALRKQLGVNPGS